jgi:hypothetical protein
LNSYRSRLRLAAVTPVIRVPSHAVTTTVTALLVGLFSLQPHAQTHPHETPQRGEYFVGGSVLVWSAVGATEDPSGSGYLAPYFHGSLQWPVPAAMLNAGVFVTPSWSIGGEIAVRRAQSAMISEDSRSMFEVWHLSPLYTDRERLISIVTMHRGTSSTSSFSVQPLGGVTLSQSTESLTNRSGTYTYFAGTVPIRLPDLTVDITRFGLVGGADVSIRISRDLSIVCGGRVHWIRRPEEQPSGRVGLPAAPIVMFLNAGVTWRSQRD